LATDSKLNVISSPSLMVLDNRTARITVGDQIPVRTETATTEGGVIIESIQFKDTGVQLEVKPRINTGGLITLDIRQDVTDAGERDAATGQRSFRQRNIESTIAIQSGDTIMLGGLITENNTDTESGVPGLSKLPLIGALFGKTTESKRRTELVVLITPRVVRTSDDARLLTDEFRLRMNSLSQRAQQTLATPQR
jgi:general secretion pathway protein D